MLLQGNLYQSVALDFTTSRVRVRDFLWIDRSTIGVPLFCIDRLLQGTLGRELLLQNYYINVTVMSKRRVVNTIISTCKHY